MVEIVILWTILCFVVGGLANARGRSGVGFFFLSVVLSPLIGLLILLVAGKSGDLRTQEVEAEERLRADVRRQIEAEERARRGEPPAGEG